MTLKGGTSHACASCKFQRRKCTSECPLAPYFPAEQPKMFQNVHRLFGVRKIVKILERIDPDHRATAMQSIIFEANSREMFPVEGCCFFIRQLSNQLYQAYEELLAVRAQLALYRQQHPELTAPDDPMSQQLQLGTNSAVLPQNANAALAQLTYDQTDAYLTGESKENAVSPALWGAQYGNPNNILDTGNNASTSMAVQAQMMMAPEEAALDVRHEPAQIYDEIHPFFDIIDDRQSYIDSKEAYESSSESSLKDTTQSTEHVAENELKSAAARFSLTSVN